MHNFDLKFKRFWGIILSENIIGTDSQERGLVVSIIEGMT